MVSVGVRINGVVDGDAVLRAVRQWMEVQEGLDLDYEEMDVELYDTAKGEWRKLLPETVPNLVRVTFQTGGDGGDRLSRRTSGRTDDECGRGDGVGGSR